MWDSGAKSCAGIVSGLDLEFLTSIVGEASNPQARIVAVRARYALDTWTFTEAARQKFVLRTSVTFTALRATTTDFVPPAPPVIPKLPSDLFYPFLGTSTGNENKLTSGSPTPVLSGIVSMVFCLALFYTFNI